MLDGKIYYAVINDRLLTEIEIKDLYKKMINLQKKEKPTVKTSAQREFFGFTKDHR